MASKPKDTRELAARALCRFDGHPEEIQFEGKAMWESYLPAADVVLEGREAEAIAAMERHWRGNDAGREDRGP